MLKRSSGFTLVELMVVITIIAILSVVGVVVYTNVTKSARMANRRADIEAISKAYETNFDGSKYPALTKDSFAGGVIPTPYSGGSYFVAGPNSSASISKNFMICASLIDDSQCFSSSPTCFCKTSTQGEPVDTFSLGNSIQNGSFEVDSNNDGAADNWSFDCNVAGYCSSGSVIRNDGSIVAQEGSFMQKVNAAQYAGIVQSVTGLKPSTTYKLTAMIYSTSNNCANNPNGVSVGMSFGGTIYTLCNQLNQWVQLSIQSKSDAQGKASISVGNWNSQLFYVDAMKLEEVK